MDMFSGVNCIRDILKYCVVSIVILYASALYLRRRRFVQLIEKIPGPKPLPILGNILQLGMFSSVAKVLDPQEIMFHARRGICKIYYEQKIARLWIGPKPVVLFFHPDTLQALLGSNVHLDKAYLYKFTHDWIGNGIITSTGDKWRERRKQLTPAFHFRILQDFIPVMNSHARILVEKIAKHSHNGDFNLKKRLDLCTLDIIAETSMGKCLNAQDEEATNIDYVEAVNGFLQIFTVRSNSPWLWSDFIFYRTAHGKKMQKIVTLLHEFTRKVIREKKAEHLKAHQDKTPNIEEIKNGIPIILGIKKRLAFLDLLMEIHLDGNQITEDEIMNEVDTFMMAGYDTTAHALLWSLYLIGRHPIVQERIQEELARIFGDDKTRTVTMQDLHEMKYIECVLKESLRVLCIITILGRDLNEDLVVEGYTIPKGTSCLILPFETHQNPEFFPVPEIFDPDRFLPENCQNRHPYAFIPFSAGPRNCIGQKFAIMEEKVVLSTLLRNFKIHSRDPLDKLHLIPDGLLKPKEMKIKFQTR